MEQSGFKEILKALELHSAKIGQEIDQKVDGLEKKMDKRFDRVDERLERLDKKFDGMRVELTETQETVDFLSTKHVQHEKKLRAIHGQ